MKKQISKKIIFFSHHNKYDAAVRFRLIQYFDYLRKNGLQVKHRPFVTNYLYSIKNDKGLLKLLAKCLLFIYCSVRRIFDVYYILVSDVVFIHREIFPMGSPIFESICRKLKKRIIFDYDDAVYLESNYPQRWRNLFRDKKKTDKILGMADAVIAGNPYLYNYAKNFCNNVYEIPTVLNVSECEMKKCFSNNKLIVGWIGSWGTAHYINDLVEVFIKLYDKRKYILRLIGAKNICAIKIPNIEVDYKVWSLDKEREYIEDIDVGIMPVDFNEWGKGKSGFKIIQFFSYGIPVVASDIGVNGKIIEHGKDGFLAKNGEDWFKHLECIMNDNDLRSKLGKNARQKAEDKYSATKFQGLIYKVLTEV